MAKWLTAVSGYKLTSRYQSEPSGYYFALL